MQPVNVVRINLWGTPIGYLHQNENGLIGFQYDDDFLASGIEVAPITMPLSSRTYSFPTLAEQTYHGLPGLVADSLPDKFGSIVMRRYLESQGRDADSLSVIEKLCYTGKRGMGALEYEPSVNVASTSAPLDIDALTKLASDILSQKESFHTEANDDMMAQLMESGSSVGGARAKTLIAWNPQTNDIRSGQVNTGDGYEYWLLKFGNIANNKDKDAEADDKEYTQIEYAYYLMATAAGLRMSECRLLQKGNGVHFMTKRFDRQGSRSEKVHMQSLCAMAHLDFNEPRVHSYEDAFRVMKKLNLPYSDFVQLFTRMVFNDFAKNFDDHTKNISFLMDKRGVWSLAPAYDVTFSYRKDSTWVQAHQMLINGKADNITTEDLLTTARIAGIKPSDAKRCIEQVTNAVSIWETFAEQANLHEQNASRIRSLL